MHKRTEIRNKVVEMLSGSITGLNVYNSRVYNLPINKMPAISVYCFENVDEKIACHYDRNYTVHIVVYTSGYTRLEDIPTGRKPIDEEIDDYCQEVEDVFFERTQTLDNTVYDFISSGTTITPDKENEDTVLIADMVFTANAKENLSDNSK